MKPLLAVLLFFFTIRGVALPLGEGSQVGGGGNGIESHFLEIADETITFLEQNSNIRKEIGLTNIQLQSLIRIVRVNPSRTRLIQLRVYNRLFLMKNSSGSWIEIPTNSALALLSNSETSSLVREVGFINFPKEHLVKISATWWKDRAIGRKIALVFHEILGLIELDRDYEVSNLFSQILTPEKSTNENRPVNSNLASFSEKENIEAYAAEVYFDFKGISTWVNWSQFLQSKIRSTVKLAIGVKRYISVTSQSDGSTAFVLSSRDKMYAEEEQLYANSHKTVSVNGEKIEIYNIKQDKQYLFKFYSKYSSDSQIEQALGHINLAELESVATTISINRSKRELTVQRFVCGEQGMCDSMLFVDDEFSVSKWKYYY